MSLVSPALAGTFFTTGATWEDLSLNYLQNSQIRSDQSLSRVRLFATLWTVAHQASLSVEFSRQEYWSGLPCPSPIHESGK